MDPLVEKILAIIGTAMEYQGNQLDAGCLMLGIESEIPGLVSHESDQGIVWKYNNTTVCVLKD